ncbi:MAG: hypothetical protein KA144_13390 [Xanthomonadaceae bacterium]|nr:hypothetical protein [Xanthomonadaceae bacterium]
MTKRIWMFFALAALALAGVAAYLYSGAGGMRGGDRGLASSKDAAAERRSGSAGTADEDAPASDSASKPRASMTKTAPLPPLETPLRAVVVALTERAEAGDARAMCRLAAEYQYCSGLRMRMKMIESGVARAQAAAEAAAQNSGDGGRGGGRFGGAERIGEAFEDVSAKYAHCEGVDLPSNTDIARYMRESAAAGHVKAASYYATGDVFRSRDTLSTLPELSLYRENAERLANAAVAQGDTRAAWALAEAYASDPDDPRRSLLAQAVQPAPEKALSLLYGLRAASERGAAQVDQNGRFIGRLQQRIASLEKELGPEAAQRARSAPSPIAEGATFDFGAESQRGGGFMRGVGDFPREICD